MHIQKVYRTCLKLLIILGIVLAAGMPVHAAVHQTSSPVAIAGPDIIIPLGQTALLDGTASFDPDMDRIAYEWTFLTVPAGSTRTDGNISNADQPEASFAPDVRGIYEVQLTVSKPSNGDILSSSDSVLVFVDVANSQNEPGSILVYPYIDTIEHDTIINIANTGDKDVTLECYSIYVEAAETVSTVNVHQTGTPTGPDIKTDFIINLTPKEKFWWSVSSGIVKKNASGNVTMIPDLANTTGYMFCFAIGGREEPVPVPAGKSSSSRLERKYNYLKGDATLYDRENLKRAFNYNAIPSQALDIDPDRVLNLDGVEYTMPTSQIMFEGFSAGAFGLIDGTLAAVNIGIDFILSRQPSFDINLWCWNEDEVPFSRHLSFANFEHYPLTNLNVTKRKLFTDAFHCATTSTHGIWGVLIQTAGENMAYAGNVWQHPKRFVETTVILPEIPWMN